MIRGGGRRKSGWSHQVCSGLGLERPDSAVPASSSPSPGHLAPSGFSVSRKEQEPTLSSISDDTRSVLMVGGLSCSLWWRKGLEWKLSGSRRPGLVLLGSFLCLLWPGSGAWSLTALAPGAWHALPALWPEELAGGPSSQPWVSLGSAALCRLGAAPLSGAEG